VPHTHKKAAEPRTSLRSFSPAIGRERPTGSPLFSRRLALVPVRHPAGSLWVLPIRRVPEPSFRTLSSILRSKGTHKNPLVSLHKLCSFNRYRRYRRRRRWSSNKISNKIPRTVTLHASPSTRSDSTRCPPTYILNVIIRAPLPLSRPSVRSSVRRRCPAGRECGQSAGAAARVADRNTLHICVYSIRRHKSEWTNGASRMCVCLCV